jgi:hypothetical protein
MKLTLSNYYTDENRYLSNSKISDYLKSPNYFYRKHILHEINSKGSEAFVIGSGVDYLLAQDDKKPKYVVVERRNLKNPPEGIVEVNQSQYDDIFDIADAVAETDVYKDIDKNFKKQVILTEDFKIGDHFIGLCGLPDFIKVTDKEIIILDLKTSRTTDPRKYFWHCKEYGYFRQQAMYQYLASVKYGADKEISSYHLVVEKTKDIYDVKLFKLDQKEIDKETVTLYKAFDDIARRKDWSRPNIKWSDTIELTNPSEIFEDLVEDLITNEE